MSSHTTPQSKLTSAQSITLITCLTLQLCKISLSNINHIIHTHSKSMQHSNKTNRMPHLLNSNLSLYFIFQLQMQVRNYYTGVEITQKFSFSFGKVFEKIYLSDTTFCLSSTANPSLKFNITAFPSDKYLKILLVHLYFYLSRTGGQSVISIPVTCGVNPLMI